MNSGRTSKIIVSSLRNDMRYPDNQTKTSDFFHYDFISNYLRESFILYILAYKFSSLTRFSIRCEMTATKKIHKVWAHRNVRSHRLSLKRIKFQGIHSAEVDSRRTIYLLPPTSTVIGREKTKRRFHQDRNRAVSIHSMNYVVVERVVERSPDTQTARLRYYTVSKVRFLPDHRC